MSTEYPADADPISLDVLVLPAFAADDFAVDGEARPDLPDEVTR
ncbi:MULTISPECIES: hypothetical protein [Halorussus]|nr:hypothetical protein [Halorussus vallis]